MATTTALQLSSKKQTHHVQLKYSAYRFRPYMWELETACLAHPHANLVLTGKDPIVKFLRRNRKVKKIIPKSKRSTIQDVFNDPRKYCSEFLETLEEILESTMTDEDSIDEETETKTQDQKLARKAKEAAQEAEKAKSRIPDASEEDNEAVIEAAKKLAQEAANRAEEVNKALQDYQATQEAALKHLTCQSNR